MENEFNEQNLKKQLLSLNSWKKTAFAISICERMFPNFIEFAKINNYEGAEILEICLKIAWHRLMREDIKYDLSEEAHKCKIIAPDTEKYDSILVSSALDAASAIALLMEFISSPKVDFVIEIASLARDSVDMYVQEIEDMNPNDPALENKILEHPLMQQELNNQRADLEFLQSLDETQSGTYMSVIKKWFNTNQSCLAIKKQAVIS